MPSEGPELPDEGLGDIFTDAAEGAAKAVEKSGSAGKAAASLTTSAIGGAATGAAVATAASQAVSWGSLGTAALISAVAPTAAGTAAAASTIGAGFAIGNAIPIPGIGAAIGAIVGAMVAFINLFKGENYVYVAKTPRQAKLLLEAIRVSPVLLPHLMALLTADEGKNDPASIANGMVIASGNSRLDEVFRSTKVALVEYAKKVGGLRGDVSEKKFGVQDLYRLVKGLKLLAREGPGLKFKGPVVFPPFPTQLDKGVLASAGSPDQDAYLEFDEKPLQYVRLVGPWDYEKQPKTIVPSINKVLFGRDLNPDPLLNPSFLRSTIEAWAEGKEVPTVVKSAKGAQRILKTLRDYLPKTMSMSRDRGAAANLDFSSLRNEIKLIRAIAGESGPDKKLSSIFGDVSLPASVPSIAPDADATKSAQDTKAQTNRTPYYVAGGLLAAGAIGAGAYAMSRRRKQRP